MEESDSQQAADTNDGETDRLREEVKNHMGHMSIFYLICGFIVTGLIIVSWSKVDLIQNAIMIFAAGLLLFAGILTLYTTYVRRGANKLDPTKPMFACKHCGEKFNSEKLKSTHERCCVKMKI